MVASTLEYTNRSCGFIRTELRFSVLEREVPDLVLVPGGRKLASGRVGPSTEMGALLLLPGGLSVELDVLLSPCYSQRSTVGSRIPVIDGSSLKFSVWVLGCAWLD